ncbi:DUF927 domain-containing protein [Porphyrobacter algicida]|uniref:DUF927 domain-containing protein n=1 Tax=Qipengyuania algicida TaxID=1836209 RepID=A0A845ASF8_9SPHN|nr:DUF927 domain-containing protein [Qipengyuania algicida]MXP29818.1 DUF927 domain-containing protein [Qipengyuania algicida]
MAKSTPNAPIELDLSTGQSVTVEGVAALSGTQYVRFTSNEKAFEIPRLSFVGEKLNVRKLLAEKGIVIIASDDWNALLDVVNKTTQFRQEPLIEKPGWTEPYYALPTGIVLRPKGAPKGTAVFTGRDRKAARSGSPLKWRKAIPEVLTGQSLPMVAIMAGFAAPLQRFAETNLNGGIECYGPGNTGKTTLLTLMASISGDPADMPTFHATDFGHEQAFAEFEDRILPIDEGSMRADRSPQSTKTFNFRMAHGTPKVSAIQPSRRQHSFIYALSSNSPFADDLAQLDHDTAEAAMQRLISLEVNGPPLGVLDFIPDGFASTADVMQHLNRSARQQFGTAFPKFIAHIVDLRAADDYAFRQRIRDGIATFEQRLGMAGSTAEKSRISSAFGLLYVAGIIAQEANVLPEEWDCMSACVAAFQNYLLQRPALMPLQARLKLVAGLHQTLDLRNRTAPNLTKKRFEAHGAFLKSGVKGRTELLLTDAIQKRYFPDFRKLAKSGRYTDLIIRDKDRLTTQRQVRKGARYKKERFYCFVLPPEVVPPVEPASSA